jgi:uncharacterized glyoxalase superfamily protein PhnB
VDDVDNKYERARSSGMPIVLHLIDEDVNGRHFTVVDPNGIFVDVVTFRRHEP